MSVLAALFFPPEVRILALPDATRPRLYLESTSVLQRWRHSSMYPAFRWSARSYRGFLRLKASLGIGTTFTRPGSSWSLREYLHDCLPNTEAVVVSLGTPGPAQKVTVQLWEGEHVVGYLKYAESPAAVARLAREHEVVSALPALVGPTILKYSALSEGQALITTPVLGQTPPAKSPLTPNLRGYLDGLQQSAPLPLERHPWVIEMRQWFGSRLDKVLEPLASRAWPVVFQHGDFAPWNVLRKPDGTWAAIDWEYGSARGFPHLDAAYYLMQVAALIRRWSPERARVYAVRNLHSDLTGAQANALVRLAAFVAYQEAASDGHGPNAPLQAWRRAVWQVQ